MKVIESRKRKHLIYLEDENRLDLGNLDGLEDWLKKGGVIHGR